MGKHTFMLGHYGMLTNIFPEGMTRGNTNQFTDIAFDAQYQYISKKHKFSLEATWIHEIQNWSASYALGNTASRFNNLDTARFNVNYAYWSDYGTFGGTVAYFNTFGGQDRVLYAPDPVDGSRNGSPTAMALLSRRNICRLSGTGAPNLWCNIPSTIPLTARAATMTASAGMPATIIRFMCWSGRCFRVWPEHS